MMGEYIVEVITTGKFIKEVNNNIGAAGLTSKRSEADVIIGLGRVQLDYEHPTTDTSDYRIHRINTSDPSRKSINTWLFVRRPDGPTFSWREETQGVGTTFVPVEILEWRYWMWPEDKIAWERRQKWFDEVMEESTERMGGKAYAVSLRTQAVFKFGMEPFMQGNAENFMDSVGHGSRDYFMTFDKPENKVITAVKCSDIDDKGNVGTFSVSLKNIQRR